MHEAEKIVSQFLASYALANETMAPVLKTNLGDSVRIFIGEPNEKPVVESVTVIGALATQTRNSVLVRRGDRIINITPETPCLMTLS